MPIFERGIPACAAVLAAAFLLPLHATGAGAMGPAADVTEPVKVAKSTEAAPVPTEAALPAAAAARAIAPSVEEIETLPRAKQGLAWYGRGLDAYNAGDGAGAVDAWTRAADLGVMAAQWNLARMYRMGDLVEADPVKALHYIRIVAMRHDPNHVRDARTAMTVACMVELADIYRRGEPAAKLEPSPRRAAQLYELAATLYGDPRAQHRLGMMYLAGDGVPQQIGRAIRWLALSARKRYAPSLAALGDFFWKNRETGNNKVQGLMWLSLARDNAKRDDLREVVTNRYEEALTEANEDERKRAMALIQTWNQSHAAE